MNKNLTPLDSFISFVAGRRSALKREYERRINRDLAKQINQALLQRNVTAVLVQFISDALQPLQ